MRSWCLPGMRGRAKGRVKSPMRSGSSVAVVFLSGEKHTVLVTYPSFLTKQHIHAGQEKKEGRKESNRSGHPLGLHLWRARIMVASVSEWHLWIRGALDDDDKQREDEMALFPTCPASKQGKAVRSSVSSFLLLFSCCWALESAVEGESMLLLDEGPPTFSYETGKKEEKNRDDHITSQITHTTLNRECRFTSALHRSEIFSFILPAKGQRKRKGRKTKEKKRRTHNSPAG